MAQFGKSLWGLVKRYGWPVVALIALLTLTGGTGHHWLAEQAGLALVVLGAAAVGLILWRAPKIQTRSLKVGDVTADRRLELEDKVRATLAQAIVGCFVLVTAYFSWQEIVQTRNNQTAQLSLATSGQVTDRFIRAIDQLNAEGKENLTKQLGGIYSLEDIARDSGEYRVPVTEVLCAFVREHSPAEAQGNAQQHSGDRTAQSSHPGPKTRKHLPTSRGGAESAPLPTDIQAVLTVLGRGAVMHSNEQHIIDLKDTDLHSAELHKPDFSFADLSGANLHGAGLLGANLRSANLMGANLRSTRLYGADFSDANLSFADLRGASLSGANFRNAHLRFTDLRGVDLRGAKGLTQKQLDLAIVRERTPIPPPRKMHPSPWGRAGIR